jgi:signal transduction histidine kinase
MNSKICFFVCSSLYPEVDHAIRTQGFSDAFTVELPVRCTGSQADPNLILNAACDPSIEFGRGIVIGSSCLKPVQADLTGSRDIRYLTTDHCFDVVAPPDLVNQLMEERYYLVTSGWFRHYEDHIRRWGFDRETAVRFFGESAAKIMHLETGIPGRQKELLEALSEYTGLKAETLNIGQDYCKLFIKQHYEQWRKEFSESAIEALRMQEMKRSADYTMAFLEINRLMQHTSEDDIVSSFFGILNLLCAPERITYVPFQSDLSTPPVLYRDAHAEVTRNSSNSFDIVLFHGEELGTISLNGIRFPEFIQHYKELTSILGRVCGLAIANARKFEDIKKREVEAATQAKLMKELNIMKDKLFSIIAHDLRSPVSVLVGYTDILNSSGFPLTESKIAELQKQIGEIARNTMSLLDNLLEWSRIQRERVSLQPVSLSLMQAAESTLKVLNASASKKEIRLASDISGKIRVNADSDAIQTVIRNLVSNAIKFTAPGGMINLRAEEEDGFIRIIVRDNGVGIPEDRLAGLFTLETVTSTAGTAREKGTGLGLSLCKDLVELHGGRIGATSSLGVGSEFWFTLPKAEV